MHGPILAASNGSGASSGALRLARLLEPRIGSGVEVVTVWEPIPIAGIGPGAIVAPAHVAWDASGSAAQREQVQRQVTELGMPDPQWPVTLAVGPAAPTIVRRAHERSAPLIVLGLGRHELVDRWFGSETALQVMRLAHVPVLAVPGEYERLPRTAVVAVDFSEFSREATLALMDLLEPGSEVHLVHVLWRPAADAPWVGDTDWIEERRRSARAELESVAGPLTANARLTVRTHLRSGEPASEILRLAEEVGAELIAAGSHGIGFLGRILIGSVSSRIVRGATCAVLVSPPRSIPAEVLEHPRVTRVG